MRARRRAWFLVAALPAIGAACADVLGIDTPTIGDDGGGDVTIPFDATGDQGGGDSTVDAPGDTADAHDAAAKDASDATLADADAGIDAVVDVIAEAIADATGDADAASDAPADAFDAADATDAAVDCGAIDTILNCGACGNACTLAHASDAACVNSACVYACNAGFSNCDQSDANLGGCACATPSCCGSACETTHDNGLDAHFYDCVDAGTYNVTQALEACGVYDDASACQAAASDGGAVCNFLSGLACACWGYGGLVQGHVHESDAAFAPDAQNCKVSTNDPAWY